MVMTELGCDPEREAQDAWLADFLTSSPTADLAGDELTLRSDTVTITLLDQEVADPDRPLVGTTWRIDTVIAGSTAASVPERNDVTLRFPNNVSFTAAASKCTSISGPMTLGNTTITFGRFSVDAVACPTPWAQAIELMRSGRTTYTIEADRLTITADDLGISAISQS
jgi:heat shock protein HslJ